MTPSEFKAMFPEFQNVPDSTVQAQLDRAAIYIAEAQWGAFYSEGVGNFVAHNLALSCSRMQTKGSTDGDNTSESAGDVSVSRSAQLVMERVKNPYLRTTYGQEYARLMKMVGMGAIAL